MAPEAFMGITVASGREALEYLFRIDEAFGLRPRLEEDGSMSLALDRSNKKAPKMHAAQSENIDANGRLDVHREFIVAADRSELYVIPTLADPAELERNTALFELLKRVQDVCDICEAAKAEGMRSHDAENCGIREHTKGKSGDSSCQEQAVFGVKTPSELLIIPLRAHPGRSYSASCGASFIPQR